MNIKFSGQFKSISNIEWLDIPEFVVISGKNGTGKSQLLDLIHKTVVDVRSTNHYATIEGLQINVDEISYLKSEWNLQNPQSIDLSRLQKADRDNYAEFTKFNTITKPSEQNRRKWATFESISKKLGKPASKITYEEFKSVWPETFIEAETSLGVAIGEIFLNYRMSELDMLVDGKSDEEIKNKIGEKPWVVLRDILREAKLPFEFNDPSINKIREAFHLEFRKSITGEKVSLSDLSSGEKVLFSLIFLMYNSQEKQIIPKMMLLDEPDAHLHPSMSKQLLNVLHNVLVTQYNVRVIMTTHSPSTVVLTPTENLFEMSETNPRISKAKSKNDLLALLTEGIVYVGDGTKYFLVEDKDDVDFYNEVYKKLSTENIISREIPMVFIPASTKDNSGGKTVVESWVTKLQSTGLEMLIQGLIDEDSGNTPSKGVHKIHRYSIENYLVDPIIIYAALMDKDVHNNLIDIGLKIGDEYKLKSLSAIQLQSIADAVLAKLQSEVEKYFPNYDSTVDSVQTEIEFVNGHKLNYPIWVIKRRGKTILQQACNSAFTGIINYATLFKAMRKLNFYPTEFSTLLDTIRR